MDVRPPAGSLGDRIGKEALHKVPVPVDIEVRNWNDVHSSLYISSLALYHLS